MSRSVRLVDLEFVLLAHAKALEKYGGSPGVRDPRVLDAAVQRPHSGFGGVELFEGAFDKAAALAHAIATWHPFVDGNKRTACLVAEAVLVRNGWILQAATDEQEAAVLALVEGSMGLQEFADWLREHAQPFPGSSAYHQARDGPPRQC
ncbi:MAG: type II toxin-antitoxin system death-on-curing family toxin [Armatimonadetes bacterium]|nr:type II toxin-antitoxin system death-on-curing family toxin [Armatimonadota bacterium]